MVSKKHASLKRSKGRPQTASSARRKTPKPEWDSTTQDHSVFRYSKEEMLRRKDLYTSKHQVRAQDDAMRAVTIGTCAHPQRRNVLT